MAAYIKISTYIHFQLIPNSYSYNYTIFKNLHNCLKSKYINQTNASNVTVWHSPVQKNHRNLEQAREYIYHILQKLFQIVCYLGSYQYILKGFNIELKLCQSILAIIATYYDPKVNSDLNVIKNLYQIDKKQ